MDNTNNSYIAPAPANSGTSYTDPNVALQQVKLNNSHEKSLLIEKNKHDKELLDINNTHEQTLKDKELGQIGKYFGGKDLTALNISGTLIMTLVIIGIIFTLIIILQKKENQTISVVDFWAIITPLITLALGYVFGNKK